MAKSNVPKKALAYGFGGLVLAGLLAYVGMLIGEGTSTGAQVAAGLTVVVGITVAFLSVFLFLLPPLLPAR